MYFSTLLQWMQTEPLAPLIHKANQVTLFMFVFFIQGFKMNYILLSVSIVLLFLYNKF